MSNLLKQVSVYLDHHDSSPGAWCLVRAFYLNVPTIDDTEIDFAYNRSEGDNDSDRDMMLSKLSADQLGDLAATLLEIADEALSNI